MSNVVIDIEAVLIIKLLLQSGLVNAHLGALA